MRRSMGNTMSVTSSPVTSSSTSLSPVKRAPLLCVPNMWGRDDYGPLLSAPPGALDRVHLAAGPDLKFDFLYLFS